MTDREDMRQLEGAVIADRYRLERYLDEGAFGAVYRGAQVAYGLEIREVAIKVAKRPMDDAEARRVFGEALWMAKMADRAPDADLREHFVTIYDAGRCPEAGCLAGHPYLVAELVRGGSLKSCLKAGPFPLKRAMAYFDQILTAVGFMHRGIVGTDDRPRPIAHRDLKPSNILVDRRVDGPDVVKVTDFGLAVEVDALLGWVETGGDLAYLPPESFSHNICSPQSDVYMLGLVFYEMLTNHAPFAEVGSHLRGSDTENHDEVRRLHLAARQLEQFPLLERQEEIRRRPALARVIRTALEPDMTARTYGNACELMAAWEQAKLEEQPREIEFPWEAVRRLQGEAEQCLAVADVERCEDLLRQAMEINRNRNRVPDEKMVARCYLLLVQRLLNRGQPDEAGRLALEGYARRRCRSTCLALAHYYEAQGSEAAASLRREAASHPDRE